MKAKANGNTLRRLVGELRHMNLTQIKALLRKKGIKGTPTSPRCCPISRLLKSRMVDGALVSVTYEHIRLNGNEREITPKSVVRFMNNFDRGRYPEFVEV